MIRTPRHKYIVRYAPHAGRFPNELYDLQADPRETTQPYLRRSLEEPGSGPAAAAGRAFGQYEALDATGREILKRPFYNPNEPWKAV